MPKTTLNKDDCHVANSNIVHSRYCVGFSDPDVMLPGGVRPDNVMEVMFYTSLGIVFAGTMCGVLLSYDGISKDRFTGVLEVKLSQPMPREEQAMGLALGHWLAILIPVWALWLISTLIVMFRLEQGIALPETVASFASVGLILFWYVIFSLIASTYSRDQGTSVAFGVGMWFLFTFLWPPRHFDGRICFWSKCRRGK